MQNKIFVKLSDSDQTHCLSEDGLISLLLGKKVETVEKPTPNVELAQKAVDFWVEEWHKRGVDILSAVLHTEFDPEEAYWYFVIELGCRRDKDIKAFTHKEIDIIGVAADNEETYEWLMEYTFITRDIGDA